MKVAAVIVAGGAGTRMGSALPKQFLPVAGRALLDRTLEAFAASPRVDAIVVALPPDTPESVRGSYRGFPKVVATVDGGARRQDSVRNALAAVPGDAEIVMVHDAVRPFVTGELLARCVDAAAERGAAVPVVPVGDTVKEWDAERGTLVTRPRASLLRAQTPQAFRAAILRDAYARAAEAGTLGTDDASLVEAAGHPVVAVAGLDANIKITTPTDLRMAAGLLRGEPEFRVGIGGDAHRLVEGRALWLGGQEIPFAKGLLGHSDGDVLLHAIADALYGAIGDADIGVHFPPGRDETRGIASRDIIAHARGRMAARGFGLVGLDAVVVCEAPRIAPIADRVRASIASMLAVPEEAVSLKGKTTEGMGFEGRGEGISAWAVALVRGDAPDSARGNGG